MTQQVKQSRQRYASALKGRSIALLFEKPSLRTRMTFELAIKQLGGDAVSQTGTIGEREPLKDVARNLDRWTDAIVARTFSQETVDELAHWSRVPVINALSDLYHPCQALADMFTLKEQFGRAEGSEAGLRRRRQQRGAFAVARLLAAGNQFRVATPPVMSPMPQIVAQAQGFAADHGRQIADHERSRRRRDRRARGLYRCLGQHGTGIRSGTNATAIFADYQVNEALMREARAGRHLHALPAGQTGQEVTDAVIESPHRPSSTRPKTGCTRKKRCC